MDQAILKSVGGGASPTWRVRRLRLYAVLACLGTWQVIALSGLFYEGIVPPIQIVFAALVGELLDPEFYRHLSITLIAVAVGFAGGTLIAFAVGIPLGLRPFLRRVVEPYLTAIGGVPKVIFLPILFLIFGLGIESKMAKGALSAFFPVVFAVTLGIATMNPILRRVGNSFNVPHRQMITKIYIPAMLDPLMTGFRLGMAMAIIGILAAEIKYSDGGLGHRMIGFADNFKIPEMYADVILIFTLAIAINAILTWIHSRFSRHERVQ